MPSARGSTATTDGVMATGRARRAWWGSWPSTPCCERSSYDRQAKVITMARYIVRRRIMEELRASGVKLQEIEPKDVGRAAQQYLDACKADLVSEAHASVCKSSD